jgi:hypothetical protein
MNCTACGSVLYWNNEENTKNNTCWNMDCAARKEALYCCNVSVRPGWYFLEKYHLPLKVDDVWYCIVGPVNGRSVLQIISFTAIASRSRRPVWGQPRLMDEDGEWYWNDYRKECCQSDVCSIPYMALPGNGDFSREVGILIDKLFSVEKPIHHCRDCGEPHDPDDECEEEALMKNEEGGYHQERCPACGQLHYNCYC